MKQKVYDLLEWYYLKPHINWNGTIGRILDWMWDNGWSEW